MKIVAHKEYWLTLSLLLTVGSIISLFYYGLPLGIDFTGGTLMEIRFESAAAASGSGTSVPGTGVLLNVNTDTPQAVITNDALKTVISAADSSLGNPTVVKIGDNGFMIRNKDMTEEQHQLLKTKIQEKFGPFQESRFSTMGPTIGESMKNKAYLAIFLTLILIVVYVAFAFRQVPKSVKPWKFGIISIVALFHDIVITMGIIAIFAHYSNYEVDSLFITALLTILGYSINNVIVVFDRLRENLKFQGRNESFADLAEKSVSQSMARCINTSVTTLITILALFFLGGETIHFFLLTLIIGITVGAYDSIFIAAPLMVLWQPKTNR